MSSEKSDLVRDANEKLVLALLRESSRADAAEKNFAASNPGEQIIFAPDASVLSRHPTRP